MSTKIYVAYKLKDPSVFEQWIKEVVPEAKNEAKKAIQIIMNEKFSYEKMEQVQSPLRYFRYLISEINQAYKEAATSWDRNPFYLSVEIAVYLHDGEYYIVPHCGALMNSVLNFLKTDENLTDFAYWDNVDRPEDQTKESWSIRRKIWHDIFGWNDEKIETPPLIRRCKKKTAML